jgi:hypothetical protein
LATFLVTSAEDRFPLPRAPRGQLVAVGVLCAMFAAGLGKAAEKIRSNDPSDAKKVIDAIAREPLATFELNYLGWTVATKNKDLPRIDLELALYAAERAVALETKHEFRLMERDTVATLHHRLGDHDRAIAIEVELLNDPRINDLDKTQDRFIATQLARFMAARLVRAPEPLIVSRTSSVATSSVTADITDTPKLAGSARIPDLGTYYVARVDSGATIVGLIVARASEAQPPTVPATWPADTVLQAGVIAPLMLAPRHWDADPKALRLP